MSGVFLAISVYVDEVLLGDEAVLLVVATLLKFLAQLLDLLERGNEFFALCLQLAQIFLFIHVGCLHAAYFSLQILDFLVQLHLLLE